MSMAANPLIYSWFKTIKHVYNVSTTDITCSRAEGTQCLEQRIQFLALFESDSHFQHPFHKENLVSAL